MHYVMDSKTKRPTILVELIIMTIITRMIIIILIIIITIITIVTMTIIIKTADVALFVAKTVDLN